jgi:16S rRNA (guanine527-N7)-methyltransferase
MTNMVILGWPLLLLVALLCCQISAFPQRTHTQGHRHHHPSNSWLSSSFEDVNDFSSSTSVDFSMDPTSPQAKEIMNHLGLSVEQHSQLAKLAVLVNDWNGRLNLISRRDCSKEVVFGRHIIPSLAPLGLLDSNSIQDHQRVVDVGTGGGFPGLPLAIAYPNVEFLLVDSIGKKLAAVQDMADTLGLTNVKIYHGRAEALEEKEFDVCVGRSVAAVPTFCYWVQHLLKKDTGHLMYMIGGDIEEELLEQAIVDREINDLLDCPGASDKRILVFPQPVVKGIAAASGEKPRIPTKKKVSLKGKKTQPSKGAWTKRDNSALKQRGYENFKRFDSSE